MNNIDILEEYIKELNKNKKIAPSAYDTGFGKYWSDFGVAIEALIAENKELKEEKKNMLETYKKINPEKMKVLADSFNEKVMSKLESDYISKSVIEKEIEEYEEIGMIGVADCMKRLLDERNNTDE